MTRPPPPAQATKLRQELKSFDSRARTLDADEVRDFVEEFVLRVRRMARDAEGQGPLGPTAEWYYRLIEMAYRVGARHVTGAIRVHFLERADFWNLALQRKQLASDAPAAHTSVTSTFQRPSKTAKRRTDLRAVRGTGTPKPSRGVPPLPRRRVGSTKSYVAPKRSGARDIHP